MWLFNVNGLKTRYYHLAQSEDVHRRTKGLVQTIQEVLLRFSLSSAKLKGAFFGAFLFLLLVLSWLTSGFVGAQQKPPVEIEAHLPIVQQTRYLHLLVTSPEKSLPACRLLISAAANNYPTSHLTSWGTYNETFPLPPQAKIQGIVDFLVSLDGRHDNDVVIIPDAEGTVFQLRPDVLLERYIEVTRLTQERIVQDLGPGVAEKEGIHQRVIFAAQNNCSGNVDDAACYAIPESPLSKNIYGSKTDREEGYTRARFLSSGFMMGHLGAVRRLYENVNNALKAEGSTASEQEILSKIFGEQEYNREVLKRTYATPSRWRKFLSALGIGDGNRVMNFHPTHKKIDVAGGTGALDFGIGLDYAGVLGSARMSEKKMAFVVHNSPSAIEKMRKFQGVTTSEGISLPEDIEKRSVRPWWSRNPSVDGVPSKLGWKDVSLLTNLWSGVIPGAVYIPDAKGDEGAKAAKELWKALWFQKFVRKKMDDYVSQPDRPFTRLRGNGEETAWWGLKRDKFKVKWAKDWPEGGERIEWVEWKDVCEGFEAEVFGDGLGVWESKVKEFGLLYSDTW